MHKSGTGATACGSPARARRHPFDKGAFAKSPDQVFGRWSGKGGSLLVQACPDFAVRTPHKIVFEGKYFIGGNAKSSLVKAVYEAFYYRALPRLPAGKKHAAWDYDFACVVIGDASRDGALVAAWSSLSPAVRQGFWKGGGVYVMIFRPEEGQHDVR